MPEWLVIALQSLAVILAIFVITKIMGKKQVSEVSFFQFVMGIAIGGIAAIMSVGVFFQWYLGFVALFVWAAVIIGLEYAAMKSKIARDIIEGKGAVLIKEGKVLEDNLKKNRLTTDRLLEQLRAKNAFRFADVEFAVLEPNGELNVLLHKESQPITAKHLGLKVGPEQEPQTVIMDGKIMDEPLATIGLNRDWLNTELKKIGVSIENVYLGQVDTYGQLTVDLFDDQIKVPSPQTKAQLLALLKKCEADIELFALSSKDKKTKSIYSKCSKELQDVIEDVRPVLLR